MTIYPGGPQDGLKYTLTGPDGTIATFNDSTDANYVGMCRPTGLDSPEIRSAIDDRAGTDGAIQGNNYRGRRPVVLNIEIVGSSTTDRNQKHQKLKRAANALTADAVLSFTPDGGLSSRVNLRLSDAIRRSDDPGWLHKIQVPMMAYDPYIYGTAARTASGTTTPVTVTNQGDGQSAPVITLVSPAFTATINVVNQTTGGAVQLQNFNPVGYTTTLVRQWQAPVNISGMAVDSSGNIWEADGNSNCVYKYTSAGVLSATYGTSGSGTPAVGGVPQFSFPAGVAIDGSNNVYVVDTGNSRVQKLNSSGQWQAAYGIAGGGTPAVGGVPQFNQPFGIAVDGSTNMYITDRNNLRVQKLNSSGQWQAAVSTTGVPQGIGYDGTNLYVTTAFGTVVKYSTALVISTTWGSSGTGNGQFQNPTAVVEANNVIYVADYARGDVQTFSNTGTYQATIKPPLGQQLLSAAKNAAETHVYFGTSGGTASDYIVGTTATISMDFGSTAVTAAGLNIYSFVNVPASNWWKLQPGDNSILVSGATSWSMTYNDSWL